MKPATIHRRIFALLLSVLVAILFLGIVAALPHWGETLSPAFGAALLGLWATGTVAWRP